jgi:2'-5' RNA ligase
MKPKLPQRLNHSVVRARLQKRYDQLWQNAVGEIATGRIVTDPFLASTKPDRRRGLTLIARPDVTVRRRVIAFSDQLRRLEPEQYFYTSAQLHLTILTFFSVTPEPAPFDEHRARYLAAVRPVLQQAPPISIRFAGITASPGAVMVQGLFETEALNKLRDHLRQQLQAHGLAGGIDTRYHLQNAHMTIARFRAPLHSPQRLVAALKQARSLPFGRSTIQRLSLVRNDWYLTRKNLETIRHYRLSAAAVAK